MDRQQRIQQIQAWLQNPDNQAKAQAAGLDISKFMPQQQDPYAAYLQQMINANAGNPQFQESLYGQYLDYTNPMNRQQQEQDTINNKYQIASDMASSDIPEVKQVGMKMLQEIYPQYSQDLGGVDGGSYYDTRRNVYADALKSLGTSGNARPEEVALNQILSTAPDQVIGQYEAPISWDERIANYRRGGNTIESLINLLQGNEIKTERLRQLGY